MCNIYSKIKSANLLFISKLSNFAKPKYKIAHYET